MNEINHSIEALNSSKSHTAQEFHEKAFKPTLLQIENYLPFTREERKEIQSYIKNPANRKQLEQATAGKTEVYFWKNFVLKHSNETCELRMNNMSIAKRICNKYGFDHLKVPEVRQEEEFVIEPKLPIASINTIKQIDLYKNNLSAFDSAAREITRFFALSHCSDLTDMSNKSIGYSLVAQESGKKQLSGFHSLRYDNIPLYIDPITREGCIGFVDLEDFSFIDRAKDPLKYKDNLIAAYCRAIQLFPLHFDIIINEIETSNPDIDIKSSYMFKLLEETRDLTLLFFDEIYDSHLESISMNEKPSMLNLSDQRKKEIQTAVCTPIAEKIQTDIEDLEEQVKKSKDSNQRAKNIEFFIKCGLDQEEAETMADEAPIRYQNRLEKAQKQKDNFDSLQEKFPKILDGLISVLTKNFQQLPSSSSQIDLLLSRQRLTNEKALWDALLELLPLEDAQLLKSIDTLIPFGGAAIVHSILEEFAEKKELVKHVSKKTWDGTRSNDCSCFICF